MKAWLVRIIALIVFAGSFALPAIRPPASGSAVQPIPGWTCALFASVTGPKALVQSLGQNIPTDDVLVVVAGLANYLFLAVLMLAIWPRLVRTRLIAGVLMLPCFIASWMFFSSQKITPLAGHCLWIAGAILILVPDLARLFWKQDSPAAAATPASDRIGAAR